MLSLFPGRKKNKLTDKKVSIKQKTTCDIFLSKISHNTRLEASYKDKVYGQIFRRAEVIMTNADKAPEFIEEMYKQAERLFIKRRGLTIPVGMDARGVQLYREISSVVLILLYLVKLLTKENLNAAVQVEHQGQIYSYSFYQDYIYKGFSRVGVVRNRDAVTYGSDVEVSLRLAIYNDLLMTSPLLIQWFGMFPDMQRLLYRSLQFVDESIFSMVSDEFVGYVYDNEAGTQNRANITQPSVAPAVVSQAASKPSLPLPTSASIQGSQPTIPNNAQVTQSDHASGSVGRAPIKPPNKELSGLFAQINGNNAPAPKEKVFTENNAKASKPSSSSPAEEDSDSSKKNQLQVAPSKAMQALTRSMAASAQKDSNVNDEEGEPNSAPVNYLQMGFDCIKLALSNVNLISLSTLVNEQGEPLYEQALCVPSDVWKGIQKKHAGAIDKKAIGKIDKALVTEGVLIRNNQGLSLLRGDVELLVCFPVDKLTTEIQKEVELLNLELGCLQIADLAHS